MKTFIVLSLLVSAFQASALTLAPGEIAKIENTVVTCQSSTASRCSVVKDDSCGNAIMVTLDSKVVSRCLSMDNALAEIKQLKSNGICQ